MRCGFVPVLVFLGVRLLRVSAQLIRLLYRLQSTGSSLNTNESLIHDETLRRNSPVEPLEWAVDSPRPERVFSTLRFQRTARAEFKVRGQTVRATDLSGVMCLLLIS